MYFRSREVSTKPKIVLFITRSPFSTYGNTAQNGSIAVHDLQQDGFWMKAADFMNDINDDKDLFFAESLLMSLEETRISSQSEEECRMKNMFQFTLSCPSFFCS